MFSSFVKKSIKKCNSKEDYIRIRELLNVYGFKKFYWEMEQINTFKNGYITSNPFTEMILGIDEKEQEFIDLGDFILITCNYNKSHKLLTPKNLNWKYFNILTLDRDCL